MKVKDLIETAAFKVVALPDGEREITGVYIGDLLSWVMGRAHEGDAWITIMSNINIVAVASLIDMACIILAEDVSLTDDIISTANQKGINILSCQESAYDIAVKLNGIL